MANLTLSPQSMQTALINKSIGGTVAPPTQIAAPAPIAPPTPYQPAVGTEAQVAGDALGQQAASFHAGQQAQIVEQYQQNALARQQAALAQAQQNASAAMGTPGGFAGQPWSGNPSAPKGTNGVYDVAVPARGGGYSHAEWAGDKNLSKSRNQVLADAFSYVGDRYVLGGLSHQGIDCSGLVEAIYSQFGYGQYVSSHNARIQGQVIPGVRTSVRNLVPGDIVAWNDGSHIAIYAGNGMIVAAASPGEGVKYQPVWGSVTGIHLRLPGE